MQNYTNEHIPVKTRMLCPICSTIFILDLYYEDWIYCIFDKEHQACKRPDLLCPACEKQFQA